MTEKILFYIVAGLLLWYIGKLYYAWAQGKILDIPGERSSHSVPTVRGGGIIFFVAFLILGLWFCFTGLSVCSFLAGFLMLGITGFIDDRKTLSPWQRFPVQFIALLLILQASGVWQAPWAVWFKVLYFIVSLGFINAFNFMDGINGITGLYALAVSLPLWYLNEYIRALPGDWFALLTVSVLAFGYFNFRKKALMFAGDVGTMSLGSVLLYLLSVAAVKTNSPIILLFVLIYGVDSAMTIIRRLVCRQNIFEAHRWHLYQKLVDDFKFSHLKTAVLYAILQLSVSFIALLLFFHMKNQSEQWISVSVFLITFVMIYAAIGIKTLCKRS